MLTSGGVQAISLGLQAFLDPGDVVAMEAPTWNMVVGRVAQLDLQAVPIPMDENGLRIDLLEEQLRARRSRGRPIKLLYTVATFNSPTGTSMSESRRRRLVELAAEWQFVILEDDVYGDLRYDGARLPDLFSMDESGLVLKIGSFSKTIAPGLRLGWLMGQPDALDAVASVRGDLGVSQWTARTMAKYMDEGLLEPHIARVNDLYRRKTRRCRTNPGGALPVLAELSSARRWIQSLGRAGRRGGRDEGQGTRPTARRRLPTRWAVLRRRRGRWALRPDRVQPGADRRDRAWLIGVLRGR